MQVNEVQQDSVRDSIVQAMTEVENAEVEVEEEIVDRPRDEKGKFKAKEQEVEPTAEVLEEPVVEPVKPVIEAPQALTAAAKAKWAELPPEVQQEWAKREGDIHKMMTAHDGELRMGREMKEVISPYMPIIMAEGGTPATAVQSLLNTAYLLRTGTPEQKTNLFRQIAQQYGVDLNQVSQPQQDIDPALSSVQQKLAQLEQMLASQHQSQTQQEQLKIQSEIQAFAADPKNVHFEQVKSLMAPLLASGQAKDLQEAYDMACHANPTIRSTLLASQEAEQKAKRQAELEAKKKAAVSVTGSPGINGANTKPPNRTVREELEANMNALMGSKI